MRPPSSPPPPQPTSSTNTDPPSLRARRLHHYPHTLSYRTRWLDCDTYAHLNNAIYTHLFDSVINAYLITHCGQVPGSSPTPLTSSSPSPSITAALSSVSRSPGAAPKSGRERRERKDPSPSIALIVSANTDYLGPAVEFPEVCRVGARVVKLGRASVVWECAVFVEEGDTGVLDEEKGARAVGRMVHVFVDRETRRPLAGGMPERVRRGLEALTVKSSGHEVGGVGDGDGGEKRQARPKL